MFKQPLYRITADFLKRHKLLLGLALLTRAAWELVPMQIPVLAGVIVDGLSGKESSLFGLQSRFASVEETIHAVGICLGAVAVIYSLTAYGYTKSASRLGELFVGSLRKRVTRKISRLPLSTQQKLGSGELLDRAMQDTGRLRNFIDQVVIRALTNLVRVGYPLAMLMWIDLSLALLALSVIPLQWLITVLLQKRLSQVTRDKLRLRSRLTTSVQETIQGAETIQCLGAENYRDTKMAEGIEGVENLQQRSASLTGLIRAVVWLSTSIGVALVWWRGSLMVADGAMTLGTLIVFTGFMEFSYRPFRFFPKVVKAFEQGRASLLRISEMLELEESAPAVGIDRELEIPSGRIELTNVSMAYRNDPVLHHVNLTIEPNQLTAIVGSSGSGKSSLLKLIPRLYELSEGRVTIDEQSIYEVTQASLRSQIAFVPQNSVMFSGSLKQNLLLGSGEASEDDLIRACVDAGAWEFVERLPEGLNTLLGADGIQLSGGQTQRMAIARALVRQPKILLLDEPTSALDSSSQDVVMDTLLRLRKKMTVVLVGHRFRNFSEADKIVVLEDGVVQSEGTHAELLSESDAYRELIPGMRNSMGAADAWGSRLCL